LIHRVAPTFGAHVVQGVIDVRLGPRSDADQRWQEYDLRVSPNAGVRRYTDGFGNAAHLITIARPHEEVELVSGGVVDTLLEDPFRVPPTPPAPLGPSGLADYLMPSAIVPAEPELERLAAPFRPATPGETLEAVRGLMGLVYRELDYEQHVTSVATTVPEVLKGRTGVCQDFAHVLIGLCRAIRVPARHVSGYIVASEGPLQQSQALGTTSQSRRLGGGQGPSRRAGARHAWAEVYTPTHGWRGFDPTNNLLASTYHVTMGIGRDYNDVPPTRGTFRGVAEEKLSVEVSTHILDR
jgi:transglutaminase-like putative cysteine protease